MSTHPHEPLSEDERALAERLARIGPHEGPSSALDAKILAAVAHSPRARRRWPAFVGAAAMVMVAVGIAWQMRPHHETLPAADEAPAAAAAPAMRSTSPADDATMQAAEDSGTESAAPMPQQAAQPKSLSAPPNETAAPRSEPSAGKTRARIQAPASVAQEAPPPAPESVETAPAAPPSPSADAPSAASADAPARQTQARKLQSAPTVSTFSAPTEDAVSDRMPVDAIPVSEDARLPPDAWLERIRARRDNGDAEGARASLALFRQTHPQLRLPDDLRTLDAPPSR